MESIDVILEKLETVYSVLDEMKRANDVRFDKLDLKMERLIASNHKNEKILAQHSLLFKNIRKDVNEVKTQLADHLNDHFESEIKATKEKSNIKLKVGIIWSIVILFLSGMVGIIIEIIKTYLIR